MTNAPVDIHQVKQLAATGHFRSIALWLNYPLVPQAIYAQVKPHGEPGYLQVLLEFERSPKQEALIRLICHRICLLESTTIRGLHLVGRQIGAQQPLWQRRIRLAKRRRRRAVNVSRMAASPQASQPVHLHTPEASGHDIEPPSAPVASQTEVVTTIPYGSSALDAVPSHLIPRESTNLDRRRRPHRNQVIAPVVHIREADIDRTRNSALRRRIQRRRITQIPREILEQQFKYVRAIVITGSAAAAFILGCVTETVTSRRGQMVQSPILPTMDQGWRVLSDVEAQEIAYRSSIREASVSAALESVAVMPHEAASDPEDPTVTLVFGGEVAVGDVPLQTPDAVGQVLGDLELFREADVAMVGLGNSLASADTSMQETYLDRTRADAVNALEQGGIDIVSLTGDHTMDFGRNGLTETLDSLDSSGIYRVGAGRNSQESRRPEILDVKGQRIAYLSYAPEGQFGADTGKAGVNTQDKAGIVEDIAALRQAVDWVVVNYRWHGELDTEPSWNQVNLSRTAIDAGADLVVGYHETQLQGAELYKSRPIVYALGDFIFPDAPLDDRDTATLRVSLRDQQMKVEFLPISIRDARPKEAATEKAKSILQQIRQASATFPAPLRFPTILEASPPQEPLLQPEKTTAPLKTLGELEPSPADGWSEPAPQPTDGWSDSWQEDDSWSDAVVEDANSLESDTWVPEQYAPEGDISGEWGDYVPSLETETTAIPLESPGMPPASDLAEPWADSYDYTDHTVDINESTGPLDSFRVEPEDTSIDPVAPLEADGIDEDAMPVKSPLPKENADSGGMLAPAADALVPDASLDIEHEDSSWFEDDAAVDSSDDVVDPVEDIVAPAQESLPGYDSLKNWGEKESPHQEFNPIGEQLNSLNQSDDADLSDPSEASADEESLEDVDTPSENTSGAISPHDEPLVGPLS